MARHDAKHYITKVDLMKRAFGAALAAQS